MRRNRGLAVPSTRGTHPLSSASSVTVATLLVVPSVYTQGSMVPQDVQQHHGPPMSGSRSPSPRWVRFPRGVTHGVPRPPSIPRPPSTTPQVTPSGSPQAASPSRFSGAPPGLSTTHSGRPRRSQGRARSTGSKEKVSVGARTHQGPQAPPGAPGPSIRQRDLDLDAAAAARGPLTPLSPRPASSLKAAAPSERRGRKPPLALGGPTRSAARLGSAAEARPRRLLVRCSAPALQGGTARAGAFFRSFTASPSGASYLDVRHVQDHGHHVCRMRHLDTIGPQKTAHFFNAQVRS
ncbi:hypothetical protein NDU88_002861 [Pleurodeles waltl]|uniref:Uncharacterized protein n=1 Tax=Pleurodeles waltl TaxID=8319 RepID=A0AAV7T3J9_PLEWA|nr:hypothetical protein NDU88_002861 [Pleurodeles waltl]